MDGDVELVVASNDSWYSILVSVVMPLSLLLLLISDAMPVH